SLAIALGLWSCVAAAHAFASGFAGLLVLRALLAACAAPAYPAAAQAVRGASSDANVGIGLGALNTGASIGAAGAAPLAPVARARGGLGLAFAGPALAGLAWIPLWLMLTRGVSPARPTREPGRSWTVLAEPRVARAAVLAFAIGPSIAFTSGWA